MKDLEGDKEDRSEGCGDTRAAGLHRGKWYEVYNQGLSEYQRGILSEMCVAGVSGGNAMRHDTSALQSAKGQRWYTTRESRQPEITSQA